MPSAVGENRSGSIRADDKGTAAQGGLEVNQTFSPSPQVCEAPRCLENASYGV